MQKDSCIAEYTLSDDALHRLQEPSSFVPRDMIADVLTHQTQPDHPLTACFTGHRYISRDVEPLLVEELDLVLLELFQRGYSIFYNGGALGFDMLAAERVLHLQKSHPDVQLIMALPCADQSARWNDTDIRRYERILYQASKTHVLSPAYYEGCMQMRNRYMVDHSDLCICYMYLTKGGTASTVAYAMQKELPVINLAMVLPKPDLHEIKQLEASEAQLLP